MIFNQNKLAVSLSLVLGCSFLLLGGNKPSLERRQLSTQIRSPHLSHVGEVMPYELPESAADFCMESPMPEIDYEKGCNSSLPLYSIEVFGGYTAMMKLGIIAAIYALEHDRCFYFDYEKSAMNSSVVERYVEPIGLSYSGDRVQNAIKSGQVEPLPWTTTWGNVTARRLKGSNHTISKLGLIDIEGFRLKTLMLMRLWRPKKEMREATCKRVEEHGLNEPYMAFSVRRGDKAPIEDWVYATSEQYIESAEKAIKTQFGGKAPKIFVATDDCTVMDEFRSLRPDWTFISECDKSEYKQEGGFALADAHEWTQHEQDLHFTKFFTELFAMTFAKYWIGVKYTNVSWFVLFMRRANLWTTELLDTPGKAKTIDPNKAW